MFRRRPATRRDAAAAVAVLISRAEQCSAERSRSRGEAEALLIFDEAVASHRIASSEWAAEAAAARRTRPRRQLLYSTRTLLCSLHSTLQCESKSTVLYSSLSLSLLLLLLQYSIVQYGVAQLSKSRRRPRRVALRLNCSSRARVARCEAN